MKRTDYADWEAERAPLGFVFRGYAATTPPPEPKPGPALPTPQPGTSRPRPRNYAEAVALGKRRCL